MPGLIVACCAGFGCCPWETYSFSGGRGRNTGGREGNGLDAIYERLWGKEKNIKIVASTNIYKRKKVSSCVLDLVF